MKKLLSFISFRLIGRRRTKQWLINLFKLFDFDMMQVAHNEKGINIYGDNDETGENFFTRNYLKEKFKKSSVVIFDVGANIGSYSIFLADVFPNATIYAFEPNPETFKKLVGNAAVRYNIHCIPFGLGSLEKSMDIFTYKTDLTSEHASVIKTVMLDIHKAHDIEEFKIEILDLDEFCKKKQLEIIHFLKIDTEGFELEVLKGAAELLKRGAIKIIQFEFNSMNVYSRAFLHDFYCLLPGFEFFRLSADKLIPLNEYHSQNEIFLYQNIIAIQR